MDPHPNLHPVITDRITEQEKLGGIDVSALEAGTKLAVKTISGSLYNIEILGDHKVRVQGGRHYNEPFECFFSGSTWGGSMMKLAWIGKNMCMELPHPTKPGYVVTTTPVESAKIIGKDYEYEMEWDAAGSTL